MDLTAVKALVRKGEGLHVEFKLKAAHPEKIVRELVAFANAQGGVLLVGVEDNQTIKGVKFVDEEEYILTKAIAEYCSPPISYQMQRVALTDERHILVLTIPPGNAKPYYAWQDPNKQIGKAYVRVADKSIQASKEVREILKGERKQRNIRFQYGEKEKVLMQYLGENQKITVTQFATIANIPRFVASRTLILLTLAHVLRVFPHESEDYFVFLSEP